MPQGGRGRGRAKGKGRAQLLADGESLQTARRPDVSLLTQHATIQPTHDTKKETFDDAEEKCAYKVSSNKEIVTERSAHGLGLSNIIDINMVFVC